MGSDIGSVFLDPPACLTLMPPFHARKHSTPAGHGSSLTQGDAFNSCRIRALPQTVVCPDIETVRRVWGQLVHSKAGGIRRLHLDVVQVPLARQGVIANLINLQG